MKAYLLFIGLVCLCPFTEAQVGIGTQTPNDKAVLDLTSDSRGLLIPRMTWEQRMAMELGTDDAGMMVYQTNLPTPPNNFIRGLYYFNGNSWIAPIQNGLITGQTLWWNGKTWAATSNLFNQGSSIGINIPSPNYQLQIHSMSDSTRIQLTNGQFNGYDFDGLILGVGHLNTEAYLLLQEEAPLWFGTDSLERMRIDAGGNVGINRNEPEARLDVNGSVRLGEHGSVIHDIIKISMETVIPALDNMASTTLLLACPNTLQNAVVHISPASSLDNIMILSARVSIPGTVEVKLMNMGDAQSDPMPVTFHVAVIQ